MGAGVPCAREAAGGGRQRPAGSQREARGLTNRPISRDDEVLRLIPPVAALHPGGHRVSVAPLAEPRTPSRPRPPVRRIESEVLRTIVLENHPVD